MRSPEHVVEEIEYVVKEYGTEHIIFQDDTFTNQWQTYRTRKDRNLALESPPHTYESAGVYRILVKVVDIFGNDTSHLLQWNLVVECHRLPDVVLLDDHQIHVSSVGCSQVG